MTQSRLVALAVATAALVGANVAQGVAILGSYWLTELLPASALFRTVLYGIWLPVALLSIASGLVGAFRLALGQRRAMRPLLWFAWAFTFSLKVDGYELGWSFVRLAVNVGHERFAVGINFVGAAILFWVLWTDPASRLKPDTPSAGPVGHAVA